MNSRKASAFASFESSPPHHLSHLKMALAIVNAEAFKSEELPRWIARILKLVENACRRFGEGST